MVGRLVDGEDLKPAGRLRPAGDLGQGDDLVGPLRGEPATDRNKAPALNLARG